MPVKRKRGATGTTAETVVGITGKPKDRLKRVKASSNAGTAAAFTVAPAADNKSSTAASATATATAVAALAASMTDAGAADPPQPFAVDPSAAQTATQQSLIGDRPKKVFEMLTAALVECSYDVISIITSYDREGVILFVDGSGDFTVWSVDQNEYITKPLYNPPPIGRKHANRDRSGAAPAPAEAPFHLFWCPPISGRAGPTPFGGGCDGGFLFWQLPQENGGERKSTTRSLYHTTSPLNYESLCYDRNDWSLWNRDCRYPTACCRLPNNKALFAQVSLRADMLRSDFSLYDYSSGSMTFVDPYTVRSSKPDSFVWLGQLFSSLAVRDDTLRKVRQILYTADPTQANHWPLSTAERQEFEFHLARQASVRRLVVDLIGLTYLDPADSELQALVAGAPTAPPTPTAASLRLAAESETPAGRAMALAAATAAERGALLHVLATVKRERSSGPVASLLNAKRYSAAQLETMLLPSNLTRQYHIRATHLLPLPAPNGHIVLWLAEGAFAGATEVGLYDTETRTELMGAVPPGDALDGDEPEPDIEYMSRPRRLEVGATVTHAQWFISPPVSGAGGDAADGVQCLSLLTVNQSGAIFCVIPPAPYHLLIGPRRNGGQMESIASGSTPFSGLSFLPLTASQLFGSIPDAEVAVRTAATFNDGTGRVLSGGENDASLSLITPQCNASGRVVTFCVETLRRTCSSRERKLSVERIAILDENRIAVASASRIRIWDISTREGEQQTCANVELTRSSAKRNTRIVHLMALSE